jgi:hypothetical protein
VARAAREAGYAYGFTTAAEPISIETDPMMIGRLEAPLLSDGRFPLQVAWRLVRGSVASGLDGLRRRVAVRRDRRD